MADANSFIDGPEDCTPDKLRLYAKQVRYAGREYAARVLEWCAALLADRDALVDEVGRLRRNDELQMNRAIAAERKLARLVGGLKDATKDWRKETQEPCEDRDNYAINGAYQVCLHRVEGLLAAATGEGK